MRNTTKWLTTIAAIGAIAMAGCAKKAETPPPAPEKPKAEAPKQPEKPKAEAPKPEKPKVVRPSQDAVYFAFDSAELDATARATLDAWAKYLKQAPDVKVRIEGNCDERGTREYNLALGQRRANSVRDYLTAHGIDASRIETVSYGEERPVCTEHNEACWAQNRRADIRIR